MSMVSYPVLHVALRLQKHTHTYTLALQATTVIGVKVIVIEEYSRYAKSLTIKDRVGGRTLAAFGGGGAE